MFGTISRDGSRKQPLQYLCALFSFIPSVSTAMIIFPELFGVFTGLEKAGIEKSLIRMLYKSLGWLFLIGVFVLMWVLSGHV